MRKKEIAKLLLLLWSINATTLHAVNLVDNGVLSSDQNTGPDNWIMSGSDMKYQRSGGPDGKAMISVYPTKLFKLRQSGITLVKGEKYCISAMIRTTDFSCKSSRLVVHDYGWFQEAGIMTFPENSEWHSVKSAFTAFSSRSGCYDVVFYLADTRGEISIADIRLEALTDRGEELSSSPLGKLTGRALVPLESCLAALPFGQKEITLFWGYPTTENTRCEVVIDGVKQEPVRVWNRHVKIPLSGPYTGKHRLEAKIVSAPNGTTEGECAFSFGFAPELPKAVGARQCNSLVTELVNRPVTGGTENISFVNPRDGWIFFRVETPGKCELTLAGEKVPLISRQGSRKEAMRRLKAGVCRLNLNPDEASGRLIVRAIPGLFKYPACSDSSASGNGCYDWAFHEKYVFGACNILNGPDIPVNHRAEAAGMGIEWFSNFGVSHYIGSMNGQELAEKIEHSPGLMNKTYQGITMDELFFYRSAGELIKYSEALHKLRNPENKFIYTWFVGSPSIPGLHHEFISASMNVSGGRGVMLFEAYCQSQATEKDARAFAENKILTVVRQMNAFMPGAVSKMGVILGNFTLMPYSLDHHSDVDYKYFLDLQMNLLANHPECRGLAVVGYWSFRHADEEMMRWSFRLLRHYAVEGKTSMLSEQYGYKYLPGLLRNGDFTEGLKYWNAEGDVRVSSHPSFGNRNMGLWMAGSGLGDDFAVFKRGKTPNSLSQTISGLIPGKLYSLQFAVADLSDVKSDRVDPREFALSVGLKNGKILPEKSYLHVDNRRANARTRFGRINVRKIVFRATDPTEEIKFSDHGAPGEELLLDFVQLKPYFEN